MSVLLMTHARRGDAIFTSMRGERYPRVNLELTHTYVEQLIGNYLLFCRTVSNGTVTNASKHSIDQSEDRILQINQSKNASKHS